MPDIAASNIEALPSVLCLQSLQGRAAAAEQRAAAAESARKFAEQAQSSRAAADTRVAQLEQQLMHAQESCKWVFSTCSLVVP